MLHVKYIAIVVLFSITAVCFGQCPSQKPSWADDGAISLANSIIKPFYATGHQLSEAKDKVENQKREERARLVAQQVKVENKTTNYSIDFTYSAVNLGEDYVLCDGEYHYWQMAQIVINTGSNPVPEKVDFTDKYGFSPRAFIPGMAQIHKGSTRKGTLFITGEAAMIGGVVLAENLRASYHSKIYATHNAADKKAYINKADNWQNIRNGLIAGAAAVYVWNVIDGIVAKGKMHVNVLGDNPIRIVPYAEPGAGGVTLALNF
jgi:hypothetical protein